MSVLSSVKPPMWGWAPHLTEVPGIASKFSSLIPWWESSGQPYDLITGTQLVVGGRNNPAPYWTSGFRGKSRHVGGFSGDTNEGRTDIFPDINFGKPGTQSFFAFVFFEYTAEISNINTFIAAMQSGGSDPGYMITVNNFETDDRRVIGTVTNNSGTRWKVETSSGYATKNRPIAAVITRSKNNNLFKLFVDGSQIGSEPISGTFDYGHLAFGATYSESTDRYQWVGAGRQLLAGIGIGTALSDAEARKLTIDPYSLIRPRSDL